MTEDEKKEFEEFLEWKAEKKRKEEENKAKQEEEERQVKANNQMPQVEDEKRMEFDNGQVPYSSNINDNKSNNPDGGTTSFPCAFVLLFSVIIFRCNMWMLLIVKLLSFKRYNYPFYKCRENG